MNTDIIVLLIILSSSFLGWCLVQIAKCIINIQILRKDKKHPGSVPHTGDCGIVYNRETEKIEGTKSRPMLPFE